MTVTYNLVETTDLGGRCVVREKGVLTALNVGIKLCYSTLPYSQQRTAMIDLLASSSLPH